MDVESQKGTFLPGQTQPWALVVLLQAASAPAPLGSQGGKTAGKGHTHPYTPVCNAKGQESARLTSTQKAGRRKGLRDHLVQTRSALPNIDEASEAQRGKMTSPRSHSSEPDSLILL